MLTSDSGVAGGVDGTAARVAAWLRSVEHNAAQIGNLVSDHDAVYRSAIPRFEVAALGTPGPASAAPIPVDGARCGVCTRAIGCRRPGNRGRNGPARPCMKRFAPLLQRLTLALMRLATHVLPV